MVVPAIITLLRRVGLDDESRIARRVEKAPVVLDLLGKGYDQGPGRALIRVLFRSDHPLRGLAGLRGNLVSDRLLFVDVFAKDVIEAAWAALDRIRVPFLSLFNDLCGDVRSPLGLPFSQKIPGCQVSGADGPSGFARVGFRDTAPGDAELVGDVGPDGETSRHVGDMAGAEAGEDPEVICRWRRRMALPLATRRQLFLPLILRSCGDRVCGGPRSSWGWASRADDCCVGGLRRGEVGVRAGEYVGPVLQEAAGKLLGELKCGSRSELFRRVVE